MKINALPKMQIKTMVRHIKKLERKTKPNINFKKTMIINNYLIRKNLNI